MSLDSISQISDESMLLSEESLREAIHHMVMADSDRDVAAMQTRRCQICRNHAQAGIVRAVCWRVSGQCAGFCIGICVGFCVGICIAIW